MKKRKWSKKYCLSKPCNEMGFSEKASCRPYINCYTQKKGSSGSNIVSNLESKYGVTLLFSMYDDIFQLKKISLPENKRGQGVGSQVMRDLILWADQNQIIISLTPSEKFGVSKSVLKRFYEGFGFKPNKGNQKDFRTQDVLIRHPNKVSVRNLVARYIKEDL